MSLNKVMLAVVMLLLISVSWGQRAMQVHQNEPSRNIKKPTKLVKVSSLYFENAMVLKAYFISGEIKSGFPAYNHALSREYNASELKKWIAIPDNRKTLTKEGLVAIENYIKG